MSKTTLIRPRVSEKAYATSQVLNTYIFDVPLNANKLTVADAVAAQFDVTVTGVNIVVAKGKEKRTYRKGGKPSIGTRITVKKAYVTLKKGDSIPVFAGTDEPEEKPKTEKKAEAKTKTAKKETK